MNTLPKLMTIAFLAVSIFISGLSAEPVIVTLSPVSTTSTWYQSGQG